MTAPSPEALKLRHLVLGYRLSRCIAVAAELGIADLLTDGPRPIDEIAAAISADAGPVSGDAPAGERRNLSECGHAALP